MEKRRDAQNDEHVSHLGERWQLREVDDVEAFARRILERRVGKFGAHLNPDNYLDALSHLFEVAVRADRDFQAERGVKFGAYLRWRLNNAVTDWYRSRFGRTRWTFKDRVHERERPLPLSLDAPANQEGDPLGALIAGGEMDGPAPGLTALVGLLADGASGGALRSEESDQEAIRRFA